MRLIILISMIIIIACTISADAAPSVGTVTSPATAGLYDRFEATFGITTSAANYYWPYDPSPNAGVPVGIGVTVDGLFSCDNWQTTIVQPAFYYQQYETRPDIIVDGSPWTHPINQPVWKIRFAPTSVGQWKYKVRVTDASGTTTSDEYSFQCVPSNNHGFVRISPNAGRYFELSDGTYVPFIGFSDVPKSKYPQLSEMGVNLVRSWWQSSNPPLALFGAGGQGGDLTVSHLNYTTDYVRPNHLTSSKVAEIGGAWASVWNTINTTVCVKQNTNYKFSCIVKTVGLVGTGDCGLFVSEHPSLVRSERLTGDNDWRDLSVTLNAGTRTTMRVYVACTNTTAGTAYISDWSLREILGGGQYGPELLPRPDLQAHTNYNQRIAKEIDDQLEAGRQSGVYIKAVIEEKADSFFNRIQPDGSWGTATDSNVYANTTHACRTYQQYYWRYLIARYGYSTALHSVELFNEADPFNGNHHSAVDALGAYWAANDPNKHLASSSNWHSFPPIMWRRPNVGMSDIHMYLGERVAAGGNRIWPGWDGNWCQANNASTPGQGFQIDETVAHSGKRSMKITVPGVLGDDANTMAVSSAWSTVATPMGHRLHVTLWAKGDNLVTYNKSWIKPGGIAIQYSEGGGDFAGYATGGTGTTSAPWGTYDWQKVEFYVTVPTTPQQGAGNRLPLMWWVQIYSRATNSATPGYLWIDDFEVKDETTGQILNYNGGFEYWDSESYDVVAGHCAYSRTLSGYQLNKPVIRGEVALCHTQRFTNPYKGFTYQGNANQPGEDQLLVDDTEGIWWRKWVWANSDPGGLIEIYWWPSLPMTRNYTYGKAYQAFMRGVPLSNGHYQDVAATVTNQALRVIGQKDLTNCRAHIWVDNAPYTWKNVVDKVNVPTASGTVTISGLQNGLYRVERWDTSTGTITRTEDLPCNDGAIQINVQNLQSDAAYKLYPAPARIDLRVTVPSDQVIPNQVVTVTVQYTNNGESDGRNVLVTARVPALMDYVDGSAEESGGSYDPATQSVFWTLDKLAAHESGSRTFRAKVQ